MTYDKNIYRITFNTPNQKYTIEVYIQGDKGSSRYYSIVTGTDKLDALKNFIVQFESITKSNNRQSVSLDDIKIEFICKESDIKKQDTFPTP
jgi:hypothetical protein